MQAFAAAFQAVETRPGATSISQGDLTLLSNYSDALAMLELKRVRGFCRIISNTLA
jgi:hypothetical protein